MDKKYRMNKMDVICECGHVRGCHGHNFQEVTGGHKIPIAEMDGKCDAGSCYCEKYCAVRKVNKLES